MTDSDRASMSDRALLEHVLDVQREIQDDVGNLNVRMAQYHEQATAMRERHDSLDARHKGHVKSTDKRLHAVEKKLLVIGTTCAVVGTVATVLWQVFHG